ncbi:MAG: ferrous iron transporter B [Treponema sp.]|jgi:ferrous iron transport protein B|nr:ferrous iron transporter B [Treponema sp.]
MSFCHDIQQDEKVLKKQNKILLMGNPNVGKSVFFTELTGVRALSSNFAGTTVSYMEGTFKSGKKEYTVIDVPGTYSMTPTSEAEAVAVRFMESGAKAVICVLDASNLERNLHLALELLKYNIPTIYALNLMDVAKRNGITINEKLLGQDLGAPVVPTVAVKKQGILELEKQLKTLLDAAEQPSQDGHNGACPSKCRHKEDDTWASAREIARRVSGKSDTKPGFIDKLGESMMKPFPGLPIAFLALALLVGVVVFGGRGFRAPLIMLTDGLIIPFFRNLFETIFAFFIHEGGHLCYRYLYWGAEGFATAVRTVAGYGYDVPCTAACIFLNVLIGEYGIFVISFQWIIALILPFVFSFYIGVSFLEDSGYLPRVSVLFDNIMRKLGVQGGSLIHVFLALGCAVPAILGSRTATTRKERLMIATIICFAIPCISQIGALIALMSAFSWWMSPLMLLFAISLFVATALVAGKIIKGKVDPLILEVPNLLMPDPKAYFRKLMIRMKHFMVEAEIPMLAAVVLAALLAGTGALNVVAVYAQPIVSGWLGMPEEGVVALILGIVRREMSVVPLLALNLTHLQAFIAGVVSLMYLPCISVFGVLAKEFKIKVALLVFTGTIVTALFVGGLINQIARLFL